MWGGQGFCAGVPHGLQLGFRCQVDRFLFQYCCQIVHTVILFVDLLDSQVYFAMGLRSTNNSLQTAPVYQMAGGESGSGT